MPNAFRSAVLACVLAVTGTIAGFAQTASPPRSLGAFVDGSFVRLGWDPPANGQYTSFVLEVGTAFGVVNLLSLDVGPVLSLDTIAPHGQFYVRLRTRNGTALSNPSTTTVVNVPTNCTQAPNSSFLFYETIGNVVTFRWNTPSSIMLASQHLLEAGSAVGLSNLVVLPVQTSGRSYEGLSVAAPTGAYWVRTRGLNRCGVGTPSNDTLVLVALPQNSATGRWHGVVNVPCNGDPLCPAGFMGWSLELDIQQTGSVVTGTYRLNALDGGVAPESFGLASGTVASNGSTQLTLTSRSSGQLSPNPGGVFSGVLSADKAQLNGTVNRIQVSWLPAHNPTFALTRR